MAGKENLQAAVTGVGCGGVEGCRIIIYSFVAF